MANTCSQIHDDCYDHLINILCTGYMIWAIVSTVIGVVSLVGLIIAICYIVINHCRSKTQQSSVAGTNSDPSCAQLQTVTDIAM